MPWGSWHHASPRTTCAYASDMSSQSQLADVLRQHVVPAQCVDGAFLQFQASCVDGVAKCNQYIIEQYLNLRHAAQGRLHLSLPESCMAAHCAVLCG